MPFRPIPALKTFLWQKIPPGLDPGIDRILRHEGQLERSFFRNLHELERIQARRQGMVVPPPIAVTITGAGD